MRLVTGSPMERLSQIWYAARVIGFQLERNWQPFQIVKVNKCRTTQSITTMNLTFSCVHASVWKWWPLPFSQHLPVLATVSWSELSVQCRGLFTEAIAIQWSVQLFRRQQSHCLRVVLSPRCWIWISSAFEIRLHVRERILRAVHYTEMQIQ